MRPNRYVHTVDDGRGFDRVVLFNGHPIDKVVYADTKRGTIQVYREPTKLDKRGKRLLVKTLHGKVEVQGG